MRRCDIDQDARTVRVVRQLAEVRGGGFAFGPPKSRAGMRVVPIPEVIVPVLQWTAIPLTARARTRPSVINAPRTLSTKNARPKDRKSVV